MNSVVGEKAVSEHFQKFFQKKEEIEKLLYELEQEKSQLRKEYEELIKKALVFESLSSKEGTKDYVKDLEKKFAALEKKHDKYRDHVDKIKHSLHF